MKCLICNEDVPNRQKLAVHLSTIHDTNMKDYKLKYKPDKDENLLECPICGQYNIKQLTHHLTWKHKLSKEDFLKDYPNTKLWIDEISDRCAKASLIGLETFKSNKLKDPHYYDESYKARTLKRNYDEINNKIRQTRKERGTNEKMSERVKKLWQDENYRNLQSAKAKEQHRNGLTEIIVAKCGKKRYDVTLNNVTYRMRSTWEVTVAKSLFERNITFKYEPFSVKYNYNNSVKHYYPDFYLEDYNLLIEVKPYALCMEERVVAKKQACEKLGYRFMFITENEMKNLLDINYE